MSAIDHALEEIIPEDLLLEPPETESVVVCTEVLDDIPLASNPVRQGITRAVSHASSTLEGGLARGNTLALDVAGQGYSALVCMIEGASASEGAAKDKLAQGCWAWFLLGCFYGRSCRITTGSIWGTHGDNSSPPLVGPVTLEVSDPDTGNPLLAVETEVSLSDALNIASTDTPSSDSVPVPPPMGFSLFLSILQVSWFLPCVTYVDEQVPLLTFVLAECPQLYVGPVEVLWCPCSRSSFVLDAVESPPLEANRWSKSESRLEGVNRRNLKFINFKHTLRSGLALELNSSQKNVSLAKSFSKNVDDIWEPTQINTSKQTLERENKSNENHSEWTRWFVLPRFGSKEPSPRWGGHKDRVYLNPFPLSNGHLDRASLFLNLTGHLDPTRTTTHLGASCFDYKSLENKRGKRKSQSKRQEQQKNTIDPLTSLNALELILGTLSGLIALIVSWSVGLLLLQWMKISEGLDGGEWGRWGYL
jgi:hypothetical protein